jgi:hypothetical protein
LILMFLQNAIKLLLVELSGKINSSTIIELLIIVYKLSVCFLQY